MNKSKLREQILKSAKMIRVGQDGRPLRYGDDRGYALEKTQVCFEIEVLNKAIDKALETQKSELLEEVRSILPKEIENHYGMISPDVGYNQAIKEMRQKLSLLEGKQND